MHQIKRSPWKCVLALLLSTTLVTGGMPAPALAEAANEALPTEEVSASPSDEQTSTDQVNSGQEGVGQTTFEQTSAIDLQEADKTDGEAEIDATQVADADKTEAEAETESDADEALSVLEESTASDEPTETENSTQEEEGTITVGVTVTVSSDGKLSTWASNASVEVDSGATAWDAVKSALDENNLTYTMDESGALTSITNDGTTCANTSDNSKRWQFLVNGTYADKTLSEYALQDADTIVLHYGATGEATVPTNVDADDASAELVDADAEWPTFAHNGNVTNATTPTEVEVAWKTLVGGGVPVSVPLLVDEKAYVAVGESSDSSATSDYALKLVCVNQETGAVESSAKLADDISDTCRPTYNKGLLYVPLAGGKVQAINVSTMKTRCVSVASETGGQVSTSLKVFNVAVADSTDDSTGASTADSTGASTDASTTKDVLFGGTAVFDGTTVTKGFLLAFDALTLNTESSLTFANDSAGYYWTNTVQVGDYVLAADTQGTLRSFRSAYNSATGEPNPVVDTLELGSAVNADLTAYGADKIVAVTRDGKLFVVTVADDGTLTKSDAVEVNDGCKAAATVTGDKAIVAGTNGTITIVDLANLKVESTISTADGEALDAEVAAPVLVSVQDDATYCYFTVNSASSSSDEDAESDEATAQADDAATSYTSGGNVYWFQLGEEEAHLLYAPESPVANYCDSPVVPDSDGSLYYLNDSGYLVKLVAPESFDVIAPEMSTSAGGNIISSTDEVTFTITQEVADGATNIVLDHTLESVLSYTHDEEEVTVTADGWTSEVAMDGQDLQVTLTPSVTAQGLSASADTEEEESVDSTTSTESTTDTESTETTDSNTVSVSFKAKVNTASGLKPYLNDAQTTASIPYKAKVTFNEDSNLTATSATESLKVAVGGGSGNNGPTTSPTSRTAAGTATRTPATGDDSIGVLPIIVVAVAVVAGGVVVRFVGNRKKDE